MLSDRFHNKHCILIGAGQSKRWEILITRQMRGGGTSVPCLNQFQFRCNGGALIKCHGWRWRWRWRRRCASFPFPFSIAFRLSQLIFSCDGDTYLLTQFPSSCLPTRSSSCSTSGTPMLMRSLGGGARGGECVRSVLSSLLVLPQQWRLFCGHRFLRQHQYCLFEGGALHAIR